MKRLCVAVAALFAVIAAHAAIMTPPSGGDTFTGVTGTVYTSSGTAITIGDGDKRLALIRNWVEVPYQSQVPTFAQLSPLGGPPTYTSDQGLAVWSGTAWVAVGSGISALPAGAIFGAACTTGTCAPSALSSTDLLFNTSNDMLTIGGSQSANESSVFSNFTVINPPAGTFSAARGWGLYLKGGDNNSATAGSTAGGVIIQGGTITNPSASTITGAVSIRTAPEEVNATGNYGSTQLIKIYSGGTTTAGAQSGNVLLSTGPSPGNTGSMIFQTGANLGTSGVVGSGNFQFIVGSVTAGGTGLGGNFTVTLPQEDSPALNTYHGSFVVSGGEILGISSKQDWFTNETLAGSIVLQPSLSSCDPCNGNGQVMLLDADGTGGVEVDYQGSLEAYSGIIDNNEETSYTAAISGTGCTAIASKTGGPTAGAFNVTATAGSTCTITLTFGGLTATGWVCHASESSSGVAIPQFQSAVSTTSCTIKGTIATSGDLVTWDARGYR
jgi:hypothetical protein